MILMDNQLPKEVSEQKERFEKDQRPFVQYRGQALCYTSFSQGFINNICSNKFLYGVKNY